MRYGTFRFAFAVVIITSAAARADLGVPPRSGVTAIAPAWDGTAAPGRDWTGPNRLAASDPNNRPQNETSVVINPSNPQHILGGCNDYRSGEATCGWFVSFDGGVNWQSGAVQGLNEFAAAGDPAVVMNRDGVAWMTGIHFNRNDNRGGIFVATSENGGRNWRRIGYVIVHRDDENPPFEDKPYIAIDNTGGEHDGNLYVSWTRFGTGQIYFSRSLNGGESWSNPLRLYAGRGQGSLPVVGPEGELYVFWKDYSFDRMLMARSLDGGESFGAVVVVANTAILPGNLEPTEFRVNSIPTAAVMPAGEFEGRIFVAWADYRRDQADIMYTFSDNRGGNWSQPVRLNDDEGDNDQFFPWMTIDPVTLEVCVVWYDRRNDADNIMVDLYGVRWNGGADRSDNERLTSQSFDPRIDFNGQFIGDYNGVASSHGRTVPAWCDTRRGGQDIFAVDWRGERYFVPRAAPGGGVHTFQITVAEIGGEPAEEGDEFALTDSAGAWVYGAVRIEGDGPWALEAQLPDGFRPAPMMWQGFDGSEGVEHTAACVILEGSGLIELDGESVVRLAAPPPDTLRIPLPRGWSFLAIPVQTVYGSPWGVFGALENLYLARNQYGEFLVPQFDFSNMRPFLPIEGYQVGMNEPETLTVVGMRLAPDSPLIFHPGWNIIPYLPAEPMDPWEAFDAVLDRIDLVKDEFGRFLSPQFRFTNIPALLPFKGYLLKLNGEASLEFRWPVDEAVAGRGLWARPSTPARD